MIDIASASLLKKRQVWVEQGKRKKKKKNADGERVDRN